MRPDSRRTKKGHSAGTKAAFKAIRKAGKSHDDGTYTCGLRYLNALLGGPQLEVLSHKPPWRLSQIFFSSTAQYVREFDHRRDVVRPFYEDEGRYAFFEWHNASFESSVWASGGITNSRLFCGNRQDTRIFVARVEVKALPFLTHYISHPKAKRRSPYNPPGTLAVDVVDVIRVYDAIDVVTVGPFFCDKTNEVDSHGEPSGPYSVAFDRFHLVKFIAGHEAFCPGPFLPVRVLPPRPCRLTR